MTVIIAGNFDVIHPGYIHMFNEMKKHVEEIHVLLHIDPSLNRSENSCTMLVYCSIAASVSFASGNNAVANCAIFHAAKLG